MGELFLTSDTHFAHSAEFLWAPRGFSSADEMNEAIIERWNSIVKPNDIVFHLGDITLTDTAKGLECFKRLNGQISVVWGNHDSPARQELIEKMPVITLGYAHQLKVGKWTFYLSHYPTKVGNYDDTKYHKMWCLCGHTHTQDKFLDMKDSCYHVEMDAHNCYPVNIEQIKEDIKQYNILQESNGESSSLRGNT